MSWESIGTMGTTAVFWDRDNTLIVDPGDLSDPDEVELLPGAAEAVKALGAAGYENVIVTNQSGIARGRFDEPTLERIHDRLQELFTAEGATINAIYHCPYLDSAEATVEVYRRASDLRKPKPGMWVKASLERGIDLVGSWTIGDSLTDAEAGRAAGCRTILIRPEATEAASEARTDEADFVVGSLAEAAEIVVKHTREANHEADKSDEAESASVLEEILQFLRMVDRRKQREDFSLSRLAGAMVQILALGAFVWALFGVLRPETEDTAGWQLVRLTSHLVRLGFAIFLQMLALTLFVISPKR